MYNNERYQQSVQRLQSVIRRPGTGGTDYMKPHLDWSFFIERTRDFVERCRIPYNDLEIIHVAGTSGKGSTSSMIANVLHAAGQHVGLFRSPFVTTSIENIEVDGLLISPDDFSDLVDWVMPFVDAAGADDPEMAPSYGEIFFAIAMKHFVNIGCEWVVLETGCGGRFDYTNIIENPRICVLTPINLDHTDILGDTLEKIAWHKAGIIKEGATVFSTETKPIVRAVFDAEAVIQHTYIEYVEPTVDFETGMPGEHQQWNAAAAAAVGTKLGLSAEAIATGIAATRLPARVEVLQRNPLVVLDGAHSPVKMRALVESLEIPKAQGKPWAKLHLVFAAKETKSVEDVLRPIAPLADTIWITTFQLPGFGSHGMEETAAVCARLAPHATVHCEANSRAAVAACLAAAKPDDCIVITGSLYLAGFIRERWIPEAKILENRSCFL